MRKWKRALAACMAAGMMVSLAACSSGKDSSAATAASGSAPASTVTTAASDNALNVHIDVEVQSLDPQIATDGTSFEVIAAMTEGLYASDADGNAVPALAQSEEISEDGLTYTFKLRDAQWSNGDPVTAQDFVFGWQRAVDPAVASEYAFIVSDVALVKNGKAIAAGEMDKTELGVTAVDDKTLQVELEAPVSFFNSLMYFPTFYPVNQKFFESCGDTYGTSAETVIANGPFAMAAYEPAATSFQMVKNDTYYDAAAVQISGLNYQVIKDNQQAVLAYQNGDLDVAYLAGEQVEQFTGDPEFHSIPSGYLWYISANLKDVPELASLNMRKALNAAYDREAIANNVLKDGSMGAAYAVPKGLATGPDGKDYRETANTFEGTDKAKALEYYEAAKKELGKDSFEFSLDVEDTEAAQNVAQFVKEEIETTLPGVTVTLNVMPKKQRVENLQNGDYQLGLTRWGPDYADPMTYLGMWYTDNANNYGFWSSKDYDAILDDCTTGELALDPTARWEALKDAEKLVMDDLVILPVYQKGNAVLHKSNVEGVEYHAVALNRVFKNVTKG